MGCLWDIWLDIPRDLESMDELAAAFEEFFGEKWENIMVGGSKPFVYHKDWEGYFAVTGLKASPENLTVPEVTGGNHTVYNLIVGT